PGFHHAARDAGRSRVFAFEDDGRARELQRGRIDAGRLHHAAIGSEIAEQHSEPAVLRVGMGAVAYAAGDAVEVELVPALVLRERGLGRHAAGGRAEEGLDLLARVAADVPLLERVPERR